MNVFGHDGDLGDICASIPSARALGDGRYVISLRQPNRPGGMTRESMKGARFDAIKPLLESQGFPTEWQDQPTGLTHDLSTFRQNPIPGESLAHWQARHLGVTISTEPWLTVEAQTHNQPIIARTERYRNPRFPWRVIAEKYPDALFAGLPQEHAAFCAEFGVKLEYRRTNDLLELAQLISGATQVFANQSCAWWIAFGLGVKTTQESFVYSPNSQIPRANARYTLNGDELKAVKENP